MSRENFEYEAGKALNLPTNIIELARKGDGYDHAFDSMNIMQPLNGWWHWWKAGAASMQSERDQLAAECAALKDAIQTHSESTHFCEVCGKDDPCSTDDVCYALKETPATNCFLAEQRAQGVEMFAKAASEKAASCVLSIDAGYWKHARDSAQQFAEHLRNEVKV